MRKNNSIKKNWTKLVHYYIYFIFAVDKKDDNVAVVIGDEDDLIDKENASKEFQMVQKWLNQLISKRK